MSEKNRFEVIGPDKEMIELVHRVIDQNEQILRQNAELIKAMTNPKIIFNPEDIPTGTDADKQR